MISADNVDTNFAIIGLSSSFVHFKRLLVSLSYVIGVSMIARGIMMYRIFANQTFGSQQRGEIAGPLVFLVVGSVLIYFPSAINVGLSTVFVSPEITPSSHILSYVDEDNVVAKWAAISTVIVSYLKLVGIIAFLRGWIILSKMGHSGSQPGSLGKGITHVIGGLLLINIVDTAKLLGHTLGYAV